MADPSQKFQSMESPPDSAGICLTISILISFDNHFLENYETVKIRNHAPWISAGSENIEPAQAISTVDIEYQKGASQKYLVTSPKESNNNAKRNHSGKKTAHNYSQRQRICINLLHLTLF